jgi:hypothetical protein
MPSQNARARIAASGLVGACALAGAAMAQGVGAPVRSSVGELSFRHPAAWRVQGFAHVTGWTPFGTRVVTYVSPLTLHDPCRRTAQGVACASPIGKLPPRGVLVTWSAEGGGRPGGGLARLRGGRSLSIGGHPARVMVSRPGPCRGIGGEFARPLRGGRLLRAHRLPARPRPGARGGARAGDAALGQDRSPAGRLTRRGGDEEASNRDDPRGRSGDGANARSGRRFFTYAVRAWGRGINSSWAPLNTSPATLTMSATCPPGFTSGLLSTDTAGRGAARLLSKSSWLRPDEDRRRDLGGLEDRGWRGRSRTCAPRRAASSAL